jgi:hypothetical protein
MTDEEFKKEVEDLIEMLKNFRRIKDKGLKKWMKAVIRNQLNLLISKND